MSNHAVLSIGGMDPSGGAGLLADIKTIHQFGVQGFGVTSAVTYQNEADFVGLEWLSLQQIMKQIKPLLQISQPINVVKVGLIESLQVLNETLIFIRKQLPEVKVIWDPVLSASAGFEFHDSLDRNLLKQVLQKIELLTPNQPEAAFIAGALGIQNLWENGEQTFILKGGHGEQDTSEDILYRPGHEPYKIAHPRLANRSIHGSGCVFASALAAGLALDQALESAFANAKSYVYELLKVSETGLGKHHLVRI